MQRLHPLAVVFVCFAVAFALLWACVRVNAEGGMCEAPLVVISPPDLAHTNAATYAAVDSYLRGVYGDDGRMRVLAFYDDYTDIQHILGGMASERLAAYSGFALKRIRWNTVTCTHDLSSRVTVNIAHVSTRFEGAVLFGLTVHEMSHLHGTPDSSEVDGASWWERIGAHSYAGTCGQLDAAAQVHCTALEALLGS